MRRLLSLLFVALIAAWIWALPGVAHAQPVLTCPAGGPGGAGGLGGESLGGAGGSARDFATASGADGGDATGGRGGAGGDGTLPICNQNTNGFDPGAGAATPIPALAVSAPVLGPVSQPVAVAGASGQTLGSTGAPISALASLAGAFLVLGGLMVFVVQPRRSARVAFAATFEPDPTPDEIWARFGRPPSPDNAAEAHARRLQRAQRRQSIIRRPAPDPFPHLERVVEKWADISRMDDRRHA